MKTKSVSAPRGFHWMKKGTSLRLMKGAYKPHRGAVKKAKFKIAKSHKGY